MEALVRNLITASLVGSMMMLLLMSYKRFVNQSSLSLIRLFWLVVIVKLMIPIGIDYEWNMFKDMNKEASYATTTTQHVDETVRFVIQQSELDKGTSKKLMTINWYDVFALIWVSGVVALLIYYAVVWCSIKKNIRHDRIAVEPKLVRRMHDIKAYLGIKGKVTLQITSGMSMPMTLGIFHRKLVIPETLISKLSDDETNNILIHELIHVKKGDVLVLNIMLLLQIMHWFNPIVWYGFKQFRDDMELYCDKCTLDVIGTKEAIQYGHLLIRIASMITMDRGASLVPKFIGSNHVLIRRIKMIGQFNKHKKKWGIAAVALILGMVFFIGSGAVVDARQTKEQPITPSLKETYTAYDKDEKVLSILLEDKENSIAEVEHVSKENSKGITDWIQPIEFDRITSPFGDRIHPITNEKKFHTGIDLAVSTGTPIRAIGDGQVLTASEDEAHGNYVVITHQGGYTSIYSHCSEIEVSVGDNVKQEEVVALSGNSGLSTGPHLHFELQQDGVPINPIGLFGIEN